MHHYPGATATTAVASTSYASLPVPCAREAGCSSAARAAWQAGRHGQRPCVAQQPRRRRAAQCVRAALLDPPPFNPSKLNVEYLPGSQDSGPLQPRCYTLTHNDLTGTLSLSIGCEYNRRQLAGWYTRIVRDEVLAEWRHPPPPPAAPGAREARGRAPLRGGAAPALHVYCHVSGEERWPAPPALRSFIFQREMELVLDTIVYADRALLAEQPQLAGAAIYVHLRSALPVLDQVVAWGRLGDRESWRGPRRSSGSFMLSLLGGWLSGVDTATSLVSGSMEGSGSWEEVQDQLEPAAAAALTSGTAPLGAASCGSGDEGASSPTSRSSSTAAPSSTQPLAANSAVRLVSQQAAETSQWVAAPVEAPAQRLPHIEAALSEACKR